MAADLRLAEDGIRRILELLFEAPSRGAFCYSRFPCSGGYVMRALHPCERRQLMHPPAALGQDLDDRDAAHTERVAHHRAVAAPRHASAHMIAMRFSRLRRMSAASASRNSSVCR